MGAKQIDDMPAITKIQQDPLGDRHNMPVTDVKIRRRPTKTEPPLAFDGEGQIQTIPVGVYGTRKSSPQLLRYVQKPKESRNNA